jgi:hypothetical protein
MSQEWGENVCAYCYVLSFLGDNIQFAQCKGTNVITVFFCRFLTASCIKVLRSRATPVNTKTLINGNMYL